MAVKTSVFLVEFLLFDLFFLGFSQGLKRSYYVGFDTVTFNPEIKEAEARCHKRSGFLGLFLSHTSAFLHGETRNNSFVANKSTLPIWSNSASDKKEPD